LSSTYCCAWRFDIFALFRADQRPTPHGESRIVAVDPAPTPRADGAASAPPMPSTEVHVDAVDVRIDGAPLVSID